MATITETLASGERRRFNVAGKYFVLLSASVNVAEINIINHGQILDTLQNLGAGVRWEGDFHGVEFLAPVGGASIQFHVSDDKVEYQRGSASVDILSFNNATTPTQGAKTVTDASGLLLAANANRRGLIVQNQDASAVIWLNFKGSAATADANCYKIGPGETHIFDAWNTAAAIYAIGSIALNANIQVTEG